LPAAAIPHTATPATSGTAAPLTPERLTAADIPHTATTDIATPTTAEPRKLAVETRVALVSINPGPGPRQFCVPSSWEGAHVQSISIPRKQLAGNALIQIQRRFKFAGPST